MALALVTRSHTLRGFARSERIPREKIEKLIGRLALYGTAGCPAFSDPPRMKLPAGSLDPARRNDFVKDLFGKLTSTGCTYAHFVCGWRSCDTVGHDDGPADSGECLPVW